MSAWTGILDAYEAQLDRIEQALSSGDWQEAQRQRWSPPPTPEEEPNDVEAGRYLALSQRAKDLEIALRTARDTIADELGQDDRKKQAARQYITHDRPAPPDTGPG